MEAVSKGTSIAPSFEDGLRTIEVLAAGSESAATGRRVDVASD